MTPEARFTAFASSHSRCFWLDGGGARPWSGRRSVLGWLTEDDVSLTYDAARREVLRHRGGTSELVGDDIFTALERELPTTAADEHWVGYLGYACRSDLPSRVEGTSAPRMPDAIWMRTRTVLITEQPVLRETGSPAHPPEASAQSRVSARQEAAAATCPGSIGARSTTCRSSSLPATPTRSTSPTASGYGTRPNQ